MNLAAQPRSRRYPATVQPEVKVRSAAVECLICGKPTWSANRLCVVCRDLKLVVPPPIQQPAPIAPPPVRQPLLDGYGKLVEDVPCHTCGYNLRGLHPSGQCPECQSSIARSLFGNRLRYADSAWLNRLYLGMRLFIGSIFLGILVAIVYMAVFAAIGSSVGVRTMTAISGMASFMVGCVQVAGMWLLTSPDPSAEQTERPQSARNIARWCTAASLAVAVLTIFQQQPGVGGVFSAFTIIMSVVENVLQVVVLVGYAAGFAYLHGLAGRIPNDRLATQTKIVGWGYIISGTFMLALQIAIVWMSGTIMAGAGMPPGLTAVMLVACFSGVGVLAFGIWAIVLLFLYAAAFKKALGDGQELVAAPPIVH